jgi:hypothetical protein
MRSISLTPTLSRALHSADYLDDDLRRIVATPVEASRRGSAVLSLDDDLAERFREAFTEHLATAGFGAHYELSAEGATLEDLIGLDPFRRTI